ncbi:hypothetical protein EDB81DRAFT_951694 [Dactylonectria macrodidyma]|uniref:Uncharacterized protein n=1 Tax=Dactylonectria macrodidyma TaxID=307937 RepID=A0A9P9DS64_9HYPO|nr:hypothetical protein EDB81DRAFT_951694 [Dactylonectria macrodidyma]
MSLPLSTRDFFDLAVHCKDVVRRIQSLDVDHQHLKAQAGALLLVFNQLHDTLKGFSEIPAHHQAIFGDIRQSCYLSLSSIEPTLQEFEKLKSGNVFKKSARRVILAVHNSTADLKMELFQQIMILSQMLLRLNQILDCCSHQRQQSTLIQKVDQLATELRLYRLEGRRNKQLTLGRKSIERVIKELRYQVPQEMSLAINAAFAELRSPRDLMNEPVVPIYQPPLAIEYCGSKEESDCEDSTKETSVPRDNIGTDYRGPAEETDSEELAEERPVQAADSMNHSNESESKTNSRGWMNKPFIQQDSSAYDHDKSEAKPSYYARFQDHEKPHKSAEGVGTSKAKKGVRERDRRRPGTNLRPLRLNTRVLTTRGKVALMVVFIAISAALGFGMKRFGMQWIGVLTSVVSRTHAALGSPLK